MMMTLHLYHSLKTKMLFVLFICISLLSITQIHAQANIGTCETPNVLILLDRSGSMLDYLVDDAGVMQENNKWVQAQEALENVFLQFTDRLRLGLLVFPLEEACDVPNAALKIPIGEFNAESLQRTFIESAPERIALTPLAGAIQQGQVILTDLNDNQRKNILILLTDGVETCAEEGERQTAPIEAARQAFAAGYEVYTIGFGSLVNGTVLDATAEAGGTTERRSAEDFAALVAELTEIVESTTREACDLLDNDCDGNVDEGIMPVACDSLCGLGEMLCVDGQFSECRPLTSLAESCDGADNDCDGSTDENITFECELPEGGIGHLECVNGVNVSECLPLPDMPMNQGSPDDPNDPNLLTEGCDGADNDGDGYIDEYTDVPCENGCHRGQRQCLDGDLIGCSAPPVGEEVCNQFDDDCDGLVDEMDPCPGAERCGDLGLCEPPCSPDGTCDTGFVCGADGYCESAPCPGGCDVGFQCIRGECVYYCSFNTDCPAGTRCDQRKCVSTGTGVRPNNNSNSNTNTNNPEVPIFTDANDSPNNNIMVNEAESTEEDNGGSCQQNSSQSLYYLLFILFIGTLLRRNTSYL